MAVTLDLSNTLLDKLSLSFSLSLPFSLSFSRDMKGVEEDEGIKEELLFVPAEDATLISNTSRRPKPVTVNIVIIVRMRGHDGGSVRRMIRLEREEGGKEMKDKV